MRATLVCLAAVLASTTAAAQEAPEASVPARLTLNEALRLAEARNPGLDATRASIDLAKAAQAEAGRRPNPVLSVVGEAYPLFESPRPSFWNGQALTFHYDQEFETAGRRGLRLEAADTGIAVARATVDDHRRLLQLEVSRAYFWVVLAQADQEVAQAALDELDRVIALTEVRHAMGETSGAELRRLQVERLRFVDDVFAADLSARNARAELLGLLDIRDLRQPFRAVDPLEPPPLRTEEGDVIATAAGVMLDAASLQASGMARRPDLRAARLERSRAETETRLQRARRMPNITAGWGYRRQFGNDAMAFEIILPIPLFGSLNPGGIERAEAERRRADALAEATARQVDVELQQAVNAVEIGAERVRYIEQEHLGPARESRDIVQASYELGAANLIDFLDAQRAFRETQHIRNNALYDLRLSVIALGAALGLSPTAWS